MSTAAKERWRKGVYDLPLKPGGYGSQRGNVSEIKVQTADPHLNLVLYILSTLKPRQREFWMQMRLPKTYQVLAWHSTLRQEGL